jgi:integrase
MASIGTDPSGNTRILFICPTSGKRRTVRPGKLTRREQETWRRWIEELVNARKTGATIDPLAAAWLATLPAATYAKLAAVQLVQPREHIRRGSLQIADAFDEYLDTLAIKPSSRVSYLPAKRVLLEYFGPSATLDSVTLHDAEKFRRWLFDEQKLAEATVNRRLRTIKLMFAKAVKWKRIAESPFADFRSGGQTNPARQRFIDRDATAKVMDACPDDEWRAIVALARYAGLRIPTELLALKWSDINWEQGRFTVYAQKTDRARVVPLFPEVHGPLLRLFDAAEAGATHVITRYRDTNANLRTQLRRIVGRAGLVPWPKTFNNLRSSRLTELVREHPIHVVTAWMGNSPEVAALHYLQVREEDYRRAAQNPAQHTSETARKPLQAATPQSTKTPDFPTVADGCGAAQNQTVSRVGFEPTTLRLKVACSTN